MGASLDRVERRLLKAHNDELAAMQADYEATREDLAKEVEDAAALEAQYAEDPTTGDKLATLKAKATRACFDAGGLSAERMVRCRGDVGEI